MNIGQKNKIYSVEERIRFVKRYQDMKAAGMYKVEIARTLGVGEGTLRDWERKYKNDSHRNN